MSKRLAQFGALEVSSQKKDGTGSPELWFTMRVVEGQTLTAEQVVTLVGVLVDWLWLRVGDV